MSRTPMGNSNAVSRLGLVGGAVALAASPSAALLMTTSTPASATGTLVVDTLLTHALDPTNCTTPVPGECSLEDAVAAATAGDTITFAAGLSGTLTLPGVLDVWTSVNIVGPGAGTLRLEQSAHARIFDIHNSAADVTISGLTLVGGATFDAGGAIRAFNTGALTLDDVVITGNTSVGGGGAIFVPYGGVGAVSIRNSTFEGNSSDTGWGGALYLGGSGRTVTIVDSTFANNSSPGLGGAVGLFGSGDQVTIANCTFTGNTADSGGAVGIYDSSTVTFLMSTISGNTATNSSATYGYGGGVAIQDNISRPNDPHRSTSFVGTVISGNHSSALPSATDLSIDGTPMSVTLANSLVGVASPFTDGGGNVVSSSPGLGALTDNGGPTRTMALLPGSPAIGAGPSSVPSFIGNSWDQRGAPFARQVGSRVDIGAYQLQVLPPPTTTIPVEPVEPVEPVVPAFTG